MLEALEARGGKDDSPLQSYERAMHGIRSAFESGVRDLNAGLVALRSRSHFVDRFIRRQWLEINCGQMLPRRCCLVALGGYGRAELFPFSDVDLLLFMDLDGDDTYFEMMLQTLTRRLWDSGFRVAATIRHSSDCKRYEPDNLEFTLSTLDARFLSGDQSLFAELVSEYIPDLLHREHRGVLQQLFSLTAQRHSRFQNTLFHLEPSIKDCPGGLRDVHVCSWVHHLQKMADKSGDRDGLWSRAGISLDKDFLQAHHFVTLVRVFLHFRHQRDYNVLDWDAQDAAAASLLGVQGGSGLPVGASYWMRLYFRHARVIERTLNQTFRLAFRGERFAIPCELQTVRHFELEGEVEGIAGLYQTPLEEIRLEPQAWRDGPQTTQVMFDMFAALSRGGSSLTAEVELFLIQSLPDISAHLSDGQTLWRRVEQILLGRFAGQALRKMHALGILELIFPEFHGIDALVIRDTYHRYTVDEHTFVLIDTLHDLDDGVQENQGRLEPWKQRFSTILRGLTNPGLLFLAALLHDTGKAYRADAHASESARLAQNVVTRLAIGTQEQSLVLGLIQNHLEMSRAIRRDVYAPETVQGLSKFAPTPEALKMLAIFTYADISAVHPDALTPWKAEKIYHMFLAVNQYLDRSVETQRLENWTHEHSEKVIGKVAELLPGRDVELEQFLNGLPPRYLLTRGADEIRRHFLMARRLPESGREQGMVRPAEASSVTMHGDQEIEFEYGASGSMLTIVSFDRPMLFASIAGALAVLGMDIVAAEAMSNSRGVVIDTFKFTDEYRTLELNQSERDHFVEDIRRIISGKTGVDKVLAASRKVRGNAPKAEVHPRVQFNDSSSSVSTVLEVTAQNTPGLLRLLAVTLGQAQCSIEVALVDTEGNMAIDTFYVRRLGSKLDLETQTSLRQKLLEAISRDAI